MERRTGSPGYTPWLNPGRKKQKGTLLRNTSCVPPTCFNFQISDSEGRAGCVVRINDKLQFYVRT